MEHRNELLTLEQLREMDGNPVFYKRTNQWFIVELHHPDFGECIITQSGYYLPLEIASQRGLYTYSPAHIDRESWKPCKKCYSCDNCVFCDDRYDELCDECSIGFAYKKFKPFKYCRYCGRPLTEEAWNMMEKRMGGWRNARSFV